MTEISIAPLSAQNIAAITAIHMAAFPQRALTWLGEPAVARYYDTLLRYPEFCLRIGVFEGETLLGYLIGGEMRGTMRSFLSHHSAYLAVRLLTHPWLLAKPIVRDRVSLALHHLKTQMRRPVPRKGSTGRKTFTVLVIAVDPASQHHGVGKMLMVRAEQAAADNHYPRMHLSVVPENTQAIRFYERLGWRKEQAGAWRGSMVKVLEASSTGYGTVKTTCDAAQGQGVV